MSNENNWFLSKAITEGNIIISGQVQVCGGRQEIRKNRNGPKLDTRSGNTKAKLKLYVGSTDISAEQTCLSKATFGIRAAKGNGMYTEIFRGGHDD